MKQEYYDLLKTWLDALLGCMLDDEKHPTLDGAILCPACSVIHGRCHDAIYPLMCMAELTGEEKYLSAARKLFRWSGYMVCDDGSVYNDSQSDWNGITVFSVIGLCKALSLHGRLLDAEERTEWERRLFGMALWTKDSITPDRRLNVNYIAAGAAALALAGGYFADESLAAPAGALAKKALECISENGLIFGEGTPLGKVTPRGVRPIDIGYNAEETLPCLYEYARAAGDEEVMQAALRSARVHLDLMLPDGAWDNSFGTRNFKWTYWGGRTSDGCQALFNALGKQEPMFAEAAYRNLSLLRRCTNGLLYGGPHYEAHGELPCVHHAFCHAKALAQALDEGICAFPRTNLPSDEPEKLKYYPEADTYRLSAGDWRMTVCAGDFEYMKGGHASGGAVTLLWNRACGPVIAAANTDYSLKEAHNQQLTRKKKLQGPLHARIERIENGMRCSQAYDYGARLSASVKEDDPTVTVEGSLCDIEHRCPEGSERFCASYILSPEGLSVSGRVSGAKAKDARFVLPVIFSGDRTVDLCGKTATVSGKIRVTASSEIEYARPVFALSPGFEAAELTVTPDENGAFEVTVRRAPHE